MVTAIKPTKDARFFSSMSNARRALKKIFNCEKAVADSLINMEAPEDGGRYWFSESKVNKAANPSIAKDKAATIEVPAAPAAPAKKESKSRSEIRNNVRRPIKGKCADVWNALDKHHKLEGVPTIETVRALAVQNGWNLNNATIEFYGWRKFHALNSK